MLELLDVISANPTLNVTAVFSKAILYNPFKITHVKHKACRCNREHAGDIVNIEEKSDPYLVWGSSVLDSNGHVYAPCVFQEFCY